MPHFGTTWVVHSRLTIDDATRRSRRPRARTIRSCRSTNFRTLAEVRSTALAPRRVVVALIGMFGLLALVITAAGIAGVIAFSVNQRTQEFGDPHGARRAARPACSRSSSVKGSSLVTIGLGIGMAGALVLTRLMGAVIFEPRVAAAAGPAGIQPLTLLVNGTRATDALTYAGVAASPGGRRGVRVPDARPPRGVRRSHGRARAQ